MDAVGRSWLSPLQQIGGPEMQWAGPVVCGHALALTYAANWRPRDAVGKPSGLWHALALTSTADWRPRDACGSHLSSRLRPEMQWAGQAGSVTRHDSHLSNRLEAQRCRGQALRSVGTPWLSPLQQIGCREMQWGGPAVCEHALDLTSCGRRG
jgi:hypothetical protein